MLAQQERLLTIGQAATQLGVHRSTLRAWADKGFVAQVKLPSGYQRFTVSEKGKRPRRVGRVSQATLAKSAAGGQDDDEE